MMKTTATQRRAFIRKCVHGSGALLAGMFVWARCSSKQEAADADDKGGLDVQSCDDLSAVNEEDLAVRKKLGYVNETPLPDNHCSNCNLYLPPKEGRKCGGCMLFKGPVFPDAYCTYWAPKI